MLAEKYWRRSGPDRIRTGGRPVKSRTLYLAKLQAHAQRTHPSPMEEYGGLLCGLGGNHGPELKVSVIQ